MLLLFANNPTARFQLACGQYPNESGVYPGGRRARLAYLRVWSLWTVKIGVLSPCLNGRKYLYNA